MRVAVVCIILAQTDALAEGASWKFDRSDDLQGWTVREESRGVVMGGALWVSLAPSAAERKHLSKSAYQVFGVQTAALRAGRPKPMIDVSSPSGLALSRPSSAGTTWQLKMRLINLSPITSIDLGWTDRDGKVAGTVKCPLEPDRKDWQDILCGFGDGSGMIDRISLQIVPPLRGDIWFDCIEIAAGPRSPPTVLPDVASARVVPKISIEGLPQKDFSDAFGILEEMIYTDVPINGFRYPIMRPGGDYQNWWLFDGVVQARAARWTRQAFSENVMRGFAALQAANPDGRIDMAGYAVVRGQPADLSGAPGVFFEAAHDIALGSLNPALRLQILAMMERYLDWWLSPVKRDPQTGLVSAIHEETFGEERSIAEIISDQANAPQSVAAVDTNVDVAVGAALTADLAEKLGRTQDARRYRLAQQESKAAINTYLWDEKAGVYYNYDLKQHQFHNQMRASMFDTMRLGIAPPERQARLLPRLTDPAQFSWGTFPLNMRSKRDPTFREHPGPSFDHAVFLGSLWPTANMDVVSALEESGHDELAAELNWQTVKTISGNFGEIIKPSDGQAVGAKRYGPTAAQYIMGIIEHLFGLSVDATQKRISIAPHVPRELYGRTLSLEDLILPNSPKTRLSLWVTQTSPVSGKVAISMRGALPEGKFWIKFPASTKQDPVSIRRLLTVSFP